MGMTTTTDRWCAADEHLRVTRNDDVRLMHDNESGLGYDCIVRRNPAGDGWDVVKVFD